MKKTSTNVTKNVAYPCIWRENTPCPVRAKYKLQPESLGIFCKICPWRITTIEYELLKMKKEVTSSANQT